VAYVGIGPHHRRHVGRPLLRSQCTSSAVADEDYHVKTKHIVVADGWQQIFDTHIPLVPSGDLHHRATFATSSTMTRFKLC